MGQLEDALPALADESLVELELEPELELESDEALSVEPALLLLSLDESLVDAGFDSLDSLLPFSAGGLGRP